MSKFNFSADETKVYDLALDLARCDFSQHIDGEKLTQKDLEEHLRNTINKDIFGGLTMYQALRRNNIAIFEIIEEIVDTAIGENVLNSPFIDEFVEVKNRTLGDTTAWYSEGGLLSVASFAGSHWDTNRQLMPEGNEFTLKREYLYIHVYEEFERFMNGIVSLDKMVDKVYASINKYIQERIYAQFQNVSGAVPSEFAVQGNDETAVGELCDKVQAAGGYSTLTIAGTKGALRKLANVVPDKMFASSQKEAKAATGSIGEWEGNKLMVIPQVLKSGTYELALSDSQLFVMGGGTKPIKLEVFGDTRTKSDFDGQMHNDQTVSMQIQTCIGLGMVLPEAFGVFTFA